MNKFIRQLILFFAKLYFYTIPGKKNGYIPPSGKVLKYDDLRNLIDASLDRWLTGGRFNKKFEEEFAKYLGVKYAMTTNSGSSANLLAISALTSHLLKERALKKGDEVYRNLDIEFNKTLENIKFQRQLSIKFIISVNCDKKNV